MTLNSQYRISSVLKDVNLFLNNFPVPGNHPADCRCDSKSGYDSFLLPISLTALTVFIILFSYPILARFILSYERLFSILFAAYVFPWNEFRTAR